MNLENFTDSQLYQISNLMENEATFFNQFELDHLEPFEDRIKYTIRLYDIVSEELTLRLKKKI